MASPTLRVLRTSLSLGPSAALNGDMRSSSAWKDCKAECLRLRSVTPSKQLPEKKVCSFLSNRLRRNPEAGSVTALGGGLRTFAMCRSALL